MESSIFQKIEEEDIYFDNLKFGASFSCGFNDEELGQIKKASRDEGVALGRRHVFEDLCLGKVVRTLNIDVGTRLNNLNMSLSCNGVDFFNTNVTSFAQEMD